MAGITIDIAQAQLTAHLAAMAAICSNQSYEISTPNGGTRRLTRANLRDVQAAIEFWDNYVKRLSNNLPRTKYIVPSF